MLLSGILALQYIPVTLNGKTVIIQIGCCKDLSDCCASSVKACTTHREHDANGAFSSCQASPDTSDYMMIVSKSVLPETTQVPVSFSKMFFTPFEEILDPQYSVDRMLKPPQAFLYG